MSSLEQQNSAAPAPRGPARAELVGSMVRPPEVIEAFRRVFPSRDALGEHPRGQGSQEDRDQLVEVATAAIASIVRRQVDAGVDVVVNGEFNRWTWWMGLYGALEGFAELLAVERSLVDEAGAAGAPCSQLDHPVYAHAADPSWCKVFRDGGVHRDAAQLAISPQCGFSSAVAINDAAEIQWEKVDVVCRVADRVWGRA